MIHTWSRRRNAQTLLAAFLIGLCAGAVTWAAERAYISTERTARRDEVQATLRVAHDLIVRQLQSADRAASWLALSPTIQSAYVHRDSKSLDNYARKHINVGFVLWDGHVVGARGFPGLRVSLAVFAAGASAGRVVVVAAPTAQLLARARLGHSNTHLAFTESGHVISASPAEHNRQIHAASLLRNKITAALVLSDSRQQPGRVYAFRAAPSIPLQWLWPWIPATAVSWLAVVFFRRREGASDDSPPATVREAVELVGETLAATHNPAALLPVILRASVRATGAAGGLIRRGRETVIAQGTVATETGSEIVIPLRATEHEAEATITLSPPPGGFTAEARDAANWISAQASIALENARLHRLVERQAITDELTGLPNRRQFLAQLDIEVSRAKRSGTPLALILADLDDFKQVNDTWGHAVGDQTLRSFASILRSATRGTDLPARLGGEEFGILLPDTDLAGGIELAERVRHVVAESAQNTATQSIRITASFGLSCFPPVADGDELLIEADKSLYQAKRRGKNTVVARNASDVDAGSN